MDKIIIIRYGEIHLKGKNRGYFEGLLMDNIRNSLKEEKHVFKRIQGRYLVENIEQDRIDYILEKLKKVSGIYSLSPAIVIPTDSENIMKVAVDCMQGKEGSFKVETNRADKTFATLSTDFSRAVGAKVLSAYGDRLTVDVRTPKHKLCVDIRENGQTLIYTDVIMGMGGMPNGSSGKALLMLSGGIDSPVAGYMIAKRGMKLNAIHFHSYPYTGDEAREKVIELGKKVSEYSGGLNLYVVKLTEIQEAIHKACGEEYMICMMRRFMMKLSEMIAVDTHCQAIITGESLGQVASQTIESLTSSNSVVTMPVLRPLIAFDKIETIRIANQIDTYDTSILPFEDCCTVFLPKHPVIKPKMKDVLIQESRLDVEGLIANAMQSIEKIVL